MCVAILISLIPLEFPPNYYSLAMNLRSGTHRKPLTGRHGPYGLEVNVIYSRAFSFSLHFPALILATIWCLTFAVTYVESGLELWVTEVILRCLECCLERCHLWRVNTIHVGCLFATFHRPTAWYELCLFLSSLGHMTKQIGTCWLAIKYTDPKCIFLSNG